MKYPPGFVALERDEPWRVLHCQLDCDDRWLRSGTKNTKVTKITKQTDRSFFVILVIFVAFVPERRPSGRGERQ